MNDLPIPQPSRRRALIAGLSAAALACGLALAAPAAAQSLKSMLASGAVGERYDGYLEARQSSARAYVNEVNGERRKIYEKRAAELGQSVTVVGKVFAKQLYQRAASGTWFLSESGQWAQKP